MVSLPAFYFRSEIDSMHTEIRNLSEANIALRAEVDEVQPYLPQARALKEQISTLMHDGSAQSVADINQRAYEAVYEVEADKARKQLVDVFRKEHSETLFAQVLAQVEATEGSAIERETRTKVDTDAELAVELRERARRHLAEKALVVIEAELQQDVGAAIEREADREIALNKLEVKLALERELDITDPDVIKLLEAGDTLTLYVERGGYKPCTVTFGWCEDVEGRPGWVWQDCDGQIIDSRGNSTGLGKNKFVTIGVLQQDLENGSKVIVDNTLAIGKQLALKQKDYEGITREHPIRIQYANNKYDAIIARADFRTKDIRMLQQIAAKKN